MANPNPNPTTPNQASKPSLFCPCCGMPAKVDWQEWYVRPGGYWLLTCLQDKSDCDLGQATASEGNIKNGSFLRQWKVEARFDLHTGKAVL